MEPSSDRPSISLSAYQRRMLARVKAGERVPARSLAVLERLGLVQPDLFLPGWYCLTDDGRAHLGR